ncbi:hypothetical protein [Pseudoduganella rhizocola]|uniref:hypothetical protein n=1 Tax=Pseudoduganella rhizocola TaxID=3382643 RepID=UPI0038B55C22
MAEQKTPDKEDTDKGYDEAAHTPWVSGADTPRPAEQGQDEDEAAQSGLGNAPRSNDPTGLQGPADNETGAG